MPAGEGQAVGPADLAFPGPRGAELAQVGPRGGELDDAPAFRVVAGVQNPDVAFGVDRDGTGGGQVTGQRAQVFPGGAESCTR